MITVKTLYDNDFSLWLEETAVLLKEGKLDNIEQCFNRLLDYSQIINYSCP